MKEESEMQTCKKSAHMVFYKIVLRLSSKLLTVKD